MARIIESRLRLSGKLLAETPIHVGGICNDSLVDLALAVDGQGRYYIPGTSLAGVLRAWMQEYDAKLTQDLWGFQDDDRGHASFILVEDSLVNQDAIAEIRDGVGINRSFGAAADKIKYDRAILAKGSLINLDLTVELQTGFFERALNALHLLIMALRDGEIKLGAAKTRGLGKVKLIDDYKFEQQYLLTPQGIIDSLRGKGKNLKNNNLNLKRYRPPQLNFVIKWKPVHALMVKTEGDGMVVNILPLTSAVNHEVALVLPGSSLKGALRSQAERIIRTLEIESINQSTDTEDAKQQFDKQIELPLITTIFGKSAISNNSQSKESIIAGLAALAVDDCYSQQKIPVTKWQQVEDAQNHETLYAALDAVNLKQTQQAYHVAIDRWTGGAAENFLYSNLEPFGVKWDEIHLKLSLKRIPKNEQLPTLALLLLVLRDLAAGRIPLGYGVNRGMGAIAIDSITIKAQGLEDIDKTAPLGFNNITLRVQDGNLNLQGLGKNRLQALNKEWNIWLECNTTGVRN
ncbi:RAMP superfamily CRISPR-associated protein [Nostoc sp. C052]|uniref:RAMP superfamily CRISPR-associated protein n=1 Tax=Nostoc sp. C052 TaxID=2576902 RepID=UPI0015C30196|nr:RAMP superfamily CRISPR-associated protein [Nostoc sp. C052]